MNTLSWFEIYVKDIERARKFYEAVLNIEMQELDSPAIPMWAFPSTAEEHGIAGALVEYADQATGGNSIIIYFSCEDCSLEASRVEENGGSLKREKMSVGQYGFVALAVDTEGNTIGLRSAR